MRRLPPHWTFRGPGCARDAAPLLRHRDVQGGHVDTIRRLLRIGPWGLTVMRYRPGQVDGDTS